MFLQESIQNVIDKKKRRELIVMLTAYDYPLAVAIEKAGVDLLLVGDSLANVALGLESTVQVGMEQMLWHVQAVVRGVNRTPIVADMPFEAYQPPGVDAAACAARFISAGCAAVKVEWFDCCEEVVRVLRASGIMVMGHVGLTPQTADKMTVRGRDEEGARHIFDQALVLESVGCFALVIECVPEMLAKKITETLKIPVIGIGAGRFCDGQVLVTHDMLGFSGRKAPRFVKEYVNLGSFVVDAVKAYRQDVVTGIFPGSEHIFH